MDPVSATMSILDRWWKSKRAKLNAKVLVRLLVLEARHNLSILDVAVDKENQLDDLVLWKVPQLLQIGVVETVLGRDDSASLALKDVASLRVSETDIGRDSTDFLTSLYVRILTLQSLAQLNQETALSRVKIGVRLANLRKDELNLVKALSK